jgi:hypothetical protein
MTPLQKKVAIIIAFVVVVAAVILGVVFGVIYGGGEQPFTIGNGTWTAKSDISPLVISFCVQNDEIIFRLIDHMWLVNTLQATEDPNIYNSEAIGKVQKNPDGVWTIAEQGFTEIEDIAHTSNTCDYLNLPPSYYFFG